MIVKTIPWSLHQPVKAEVSYGGNKEAAKVVGRVLAEKAQKAGISTVIFDRGGFIYHGRIKELADAARETGLEF
jgi:large subunit ribosomal protein L18